MKLEELFEKHADIPFNFNLEQMKKLVNSPRMHIPKGLTREQRRKYIEEKV